MKRVIRAYSTETEDDIEEDIYLNPDLKPDRTEQLETYERLSSDINNKISLDKMDPVVISNSSRFRPLVFGDNRSNACGTL